MISLSRLPLPKYIALVLVLCLWSCSEDRARQATQAEPLIPEGFEILQSDTISLGDEVFVINALKYQKEDSLAEHSQEIVRPITILKKTPDSQYQLMARNDSVILCLQCGGIFGDPWDGMYAEEKSFTVSHAGGSSDRWTRNIRFQYNETKRGWFLTSDRGASFSTNDPEGTFKMTTYTPGDSLGLTPFESFKTAF